MPGSDVTIPKTPLTSEVREVTWVARVAPRLLRALVAVFSWLIRVVEALLPAEMTWASWVLAVFRADCSPEVAVLRPLVRVDGRVVNPLLMALVKVLWRPVSVDWSWVSAEEAALVSELLARAVWIWDSRLAMVVCSDEVVVESVDSAVDRMGAGLPVATYLRGK